MAVQHGNRLIWKGNDRKLLRKLQSAVAEMQARDERLDARPDAPQSFDYYFDDGLKNGSWAALKTVMSRITYLLTVKVQTVQPVA